MSTVEPVAGGEPGFEDDEPITVEEEARAQGWRPLSEHRGDPKYWLDAAAYLERGRDSLPILRAQNRSLTAKVARLERNEGTLRQSVSDAIKLAKSANEAGYQRALADLKRQHRQAVEEGNADAAETASDAISAMVAERAKQPEPAEPAAEPAPRPGDAVPPTHPAIIAFRQNNPWFDPRNSVGKAMVSYLGIMEAKYPTLALEAQLERAKANVRRDFPSAFGDGTAGDEEPGDGDEPEMPPDDEPEPAPRRRVASVARPGGNLGPRRQAGGISSLPPGEQAGARSALASINRSLPNSEPPLTEAEYVRLYNDPHGDILQFRRERLRGK